jgi:hypothetical protein
MASDFQQRDNSGSLFINQRKEKETHPDFTGKLKIGADLLEAIRSGEEVQISGWKNKTKNGDTWLSLSVQAVRKKEDAPPRQQQARLDDDEAPF